MICVYVVILRHTRITLTHARQSMFRFCIFPITYRLLAGLMAFSIAASSQAQTKRPVPYPVMPPPQFEKAIANGTRTTTGKPGPNYWTNTAEYTIRAILSPNTKQLRGVEMIRYHNNSPDTLRQIIVHLRQNLNKAGVVRNRPQKLTGGVILTDVRLNDAPLIESVSRDDGGYTLDGTRLYLPLDTPLLPRDEASLAFSWHFEVPEAGAPRMGQDGDVFFLGYWYPQIAVYDDVNGWTADPYMGNGEFYMDYGTYDVSLTVPEGWLVGATGELQNPEAVYSDQTRARLDMAAGTRAIVHVVEDVDRKPGLSTNDSPSDSLTWHFLAEHVRDFAFATSAHYLMDATTATVGDRDGDGTDDTAMIYAFHRPEAVSWERSAEFAQYSIEYLSKMFMPYPYPHMTTAEGVIGGGMEYPMITHIGGARNDRRLFGVTFHEIGHMWFPMVVGQNEKAFTWMDEGLTTYNTNEGTADFWNVNGWDLKRQYYYMIAGSGHEVVPMRHGDRYPVDGPSRTIASYSKPAVALHALRGLFGQEKFMAAYREYARRWAFKHPQPYDLFNTFDDVLGEDLGWFWTTMFSTTWTLDQAIGNVEETPFGPVVTIEDHGLSPFPVLLRITYADGKVVDKRVTVRVWLSGARETKLRLDPGTLSRLEIDPDDYLPDVDRTNNVWEPPDATSLGR